MPRKLKGTRCALTCVHRNAGTHDVRSSTAVIAMLMGNETACNVRHLEVKRPLNRLIRKAGFQQKRGVAIRNSVGITGAAGAETGNVDH